MPTMDAEPVLKMTEAGGWVSVRIGETNVDADCQPIPAGQAGAYTYAYAGASVLAGAQFLPEQLAKHYPRATPSELDYPQDPSWYMVNARDAAESVQSTATGPTFLSTLGGLDQQQHPLHTEHHFAPRRLTPNALVGLNTGPVEEHAGGAIQEWIPTRIGDRFAAPSAVDEQHVDFASGSASQYDTWTEASGDGGFFHWEDLADRDIDRDTRGFGSVFAPLPASEADAYSETLELEEGMLEWPIHDQAA